MTTRDRVPGSPWEILAPACLPLALALSSLVLLVAFQHVVRDGVQQGETRRKAVATRADAQWRCKALPGPRQRVDCLLQLGPVFGDAVALPAEHLGAAALQ
jgi:hypothetical protein